MGAVWGALLGAFWLWPSPLAAQPEPPLPPPAASDGSSAPKTDAAPAGGKGSILDLDVEQLAKTDVVVPSMDLEVTSVSKQESTVGRSPTAVFVITQDMIRRSGAKCIPEALRMSPGLEVAQISSNTWAITCRGFNGRYANKLLVLMDGRTLYNSTYSGVYWDTQDTLMEDIERIEVIRGPGGTLWGANAVNGVINIITKSAKETHGGYLMSGGGTAERLTHGVRYGGQIGEAFHYRAYAKQFELAPGFVPGEDAHDDTRQGRFGFRTDWDLDPEKCNNLTVQGDFYEGESGFEDRFLRPVLSSYRVPYVADDHVRGQNVLTRWTHTYDEDNDWTLQMYFDRYERNNPGLLQAANALDVDYQYRFPLTERQKIIWGLEYRHIHDHLLGPDPFTLQFNPPQRSTDTASAFVQDEIMLVEDRLSFTAGSKFESNDYTGFEYQPTGRLLWTPDRKHSAWGAISRAVRTPSRLDDGLVSAATPVSGAFPRILGNPGFESEDLVAYELGYRVQATERFSWDLAMFYNVYDHLRSLTWGTPFAEFSPLPPHLIVPVTLTNNGSGETYGVEWSANWAVTDWWRLSGAYTFLRMQIHTDPVLEEEQGMSPRNQVYLRSSWDLSRDVEFDLMTRYVDNLPEAGVRGYISIDARLGWRPWTNLELAVVGQNLLESHHREFSHDIASSMQVTEVDRGVYGTATWRF
ncbi:MAG: TonB-dependent receptor plug domain-containing protein [Pirellulales bacterium]